MFGDNKTYFADSPVVIDISGLTWPTENNVPTSPFNIVRVKVIYSGKTVGEFHADTGGQSSISFDISSALRVIWADYDFHYEVGEAYALNGMEPRTYRAYSLEVYTEYLSTDGVYTVTSVATGGGKCAIGHLTEFERSQIANKEDADMSHWNSSNRRNGDASTKPTSSPERVGSTSITSWVDFVSGSTDHHYYASTATPAADGTTAHAPIVLRDSQPYVDFLFLNRRGAVETCSGMTKEMMEIDNSVKTYSHTEGPSFKPTRSLTAIGSDGRRSWQMSSGYVTRDWAEWWAQEFLGGKRKQWWMLWRGPGMAKAMYVPVIVKPSKSSITIYDRQKQDMPHVDFIVTLALEG